MITIIGKSLLNASLNFSNKSISEELTASYLCLQSEGGKLVYHEKDHLQKAVLHNVTMHGTFVLTKTTGGI